MHMTFRERATAILRDRYSRGLILLTLPLGVWWVLLVLVEPGWNYFMRLPGEVAVPMLIGALVAWANYLAKDSD